MLDIFYAHKQKLLIPDEVEHPSEEILSEIKTASLLMQWINEASEDSIVGHFGVGPGDIHTMVELSDWLLYSASEIAKVFGLKKEEKAIFPLRIQVVYGVKEELLPLVSLKGIGRIRARNLYNAGYRNAKDIKKATVEELSKVPAIGRTVAENIKKQMEGQI